MSKIEKENNNTMKSGGTKRLGYTKRGSWILIKNKTKRESQACSS